MMSIALAGPEFIGNPQAQLTTDEKYSPDVLLDLKNRLVEAYREAYGELTTSITADSEPEAVKLRPGVMHVTPAEFEEIFGFNPLEHDDETDEPDGSA